MTLRHARPTNDKGGLNAPGREPTDRRPRQVILLVEDNEADRDVYGGLLWYNGYDVVHAADGATAIARAAERNPDLVLLDLRLEGELTGPETCRRLREAGMTAPVIALSAVPREEAVEALEGLGVVRYMEKPVDPFAVVREVQRRVGFAASEPDGG